MKNLFFLIFSVEISLKAFNFQYLWSKFPKNIVSQLFSLHISLKAYNFQYFTTYFTKKNLMFKICTTDFNKKYTFEQNSYTSQHISYIFNKIFTPLKY